MPKEVKICTQQDHKEFFLFTMKLQVIKQIKEDPFRLGGLFSITDQMRNFSFIHLKIIHWYAQDYLKIVMEESDLQNNRTKYVVLNKYLVLLIRL